ncbi:heat shock protein 75 kDa, mitochondrial-like isoform X3 [Procambarus clarkii]|uniref:heat shock protein 75 kDa, mitochondrial-like isoform X3 n=1 Tax=Procambarus clarkii TaxID=6728 RepID=UPI00374342CB
MLGSEGYFSSEVASMCHHCGRDGCSKTLRTHSIYTVPEETRYSLLQPQLEINPRSVARVDKYWIRGVKERNVEVLFCYDPYDEVVLMQLREFTNRKIVSVEKEMRQDKEAVDNEGTESSLRRSQANEFMDWLKTVLAGRCWGVKATSRLESQPCVITVEEMGAARHFVRTQFTQYPKRPDTHFCSLSWKLIQGV